MKTCHHCGYTAERPFKTYDNGLSFCLDHVDCQERRYIRENPATTLEMIHDQLGSDNISGWHAVELAYALGKEDAFKIAQKRLEESFPFLASEDSGPQPILEAVDLNAFKDV